MRDNYQLVTQGFKLLNEMLAPYVATQLQGRLGRENWWQKGVLDILYEDQIRDLPREGEWGELVDSLDPARCLLLIDLHWNSVFKFKLSREHRNWVKELKTTRNRWAHTGLFDISDDDAWRALDTMARLMEQIDAENTEKLRELARQVRYGTTGASTTNVRNGNPTPVTNLTRLSGVLTENPRPGLKPWRLVVEPHPDVAQGRYRQAEFAADLSQVLRGTAAVEYQDPVEFFGRTYITEGMRGLLVQATERLTGRGGEPVVQLKTAFGGGKTHSMLALYHLFRGQAPLSKMPNVDQVLKEEGFNTIPKARVAVLVGTALDPTKVRKPPNHPGISIRTLWGELAAQLSDQAGNAQIYNIIREADKHGVSPGSDTLKELLEATQPCLILIDELVAYARKLYGVSGLPAGSFENLLTFIQELTEAVRKTDNCMLIASVPESDIEIGGEAGRQTLEHVEHVFGRMEAIWKPVGTEEGFEIVRRRLFLDIMDSGAADDVCRAFSDMYRESNADFPSECKELAYLQRMRACYPIHPEVFDRLYNEWAALERFQKTRGVLRLMAAVIHHLWINQDAGLMIMPSSIPLDNSVIRDELTRYLPEGWNAVIERDVDGPRSLPMQIDQHNPRFGRIMAARRVARTIFLGSATSVRQQSVRGIEDIRIRLGTVQPGEQVSVFNDALGRAVEQLTYLYNSRGRYWYDTIPNLRRTVEDRAQQYKDDEIEYEIESRIRATISKGDFAAVHTVFGISDDVPDNQEARLVILGPDQTHKHALENSPAIQQANHILNQRGNGPRIYRNTLVFVAPDKDLVEHLKREVRYYLAWKSVLDDVEVLNLDAQQQRQAEESKKTSDDLVKMRIQEAYCWLLVPVQVGTGPLEWDITRISGNENIVAKAARSLKASESLILKWAAAPLRMELDRWLWVNADHLQIRDLWNYLTTYCYLPRLKNEAVLLAAIQDGLMSDEFFGYAQAITPAGDYLGLRLGTEGPLVAVDCSGFLVKPDVARQKLLASRPQPGNTGIPDGPRPPYPPIQPEDGSIGDPPSSPDISKPEAKIRRFYASCQLHPTRIGRDAGRIAEEVVQHLSVLEGAEVEVTMEIQVKVPNGIGDNVVRIISENCKTLRFHDYGFEEE